MQALLGLKLDILVNMLDRYDDLVARSKLIAKLERKLLKQADKISHIPPGIDFYHDTRAKLSHYLFLLRLGEATRVQLWMEYSLIFKLTADDLCDKHSKVERLIGCWDKCNACYIKYTKNGIYDQLVTNLHNITALSINLINPQDRVYALGWQLLYCLRIMEQVAYYIKDPKMREFYLQARNLAVNSMQQLQNLPEEQPKQHRLLFNFCTSRKIMPVVNAHELRENRAGF